MNRMIFTAALAATLSAFAFAGVAEAKKKPAPAEASQQDGAQQGGEAAPGGDPNAENGGIPKYQPFPHFRNFNLVEINGKAPPVDVWINIDATGHAAGFDGCKHWNAVFVIGGDRLGPKSMPAMKDTKCDPALAAFEHEFWNVMIQGPFWSTKGDELTFKAPKGGATLRFQRGL